MTRGLSRPLRGRSGRLPYAFVGIIVLAAMVILTAYFEVAVTWSNNQGSFNVPEQINGALALASRNIGQAAFLDLMSAESNLLLQSPNPPIDQLNSSLGVMFSGSLQNLGLSTPQGFVDGPVVVRAMSWGINLTWDQGEVQSAVSTVALQSGSNDPNLPLAQVPDASRPTSLASTELPVYPMAVGEVLLFATDSSTGVSEWQTVPFTETVQSELGLLEDSAAQFSDAAYGPNGQFAHLVQYLTTTFGELRALSGYGAGGWPTWGPNAGKQTTSVANGNCGGPAAPSILSCDDLHNAVSLATLLTSLQYFRSYDPTAVSTFLSSMSPSPYRTLLTSYVSDGVVDGAALYLLLYAQNNGTWSDGWVSSGAGLASAAYSFVDRYRYDLFQNFWHQQVVDPTLTNPVVNWNLIASQGSNYAENMLTQWLHQYQYWLGITITSIPKYNVVAPIPDEWCTDGGNCGTGPAPGGPGVCTYIIFPGGTIGVSNTYVPDMIDLLLGTTSNNPYQYNPVQFNVFENVTVQDPYGGANWRDLNEQAGYTVVDNSLIGEYAPNPILPSPVPTANPYQSTLFQILQSLNASMDHKSPANTQILYKGLLDYIAYAADKAGTNLTWAQAGIPYLQSPAGLAQILNSTTYSLLTNGTSQLFAYPFALALQKLATEASNSTWLNNTWIYGASHPSQMGPDNPYPDQPTWWTMSDIARVTARLYFQEMYMLWYGSAGVIPTSPVGAIDYGLMDAAQYNVVSPGVQHGSPYPFHEPDFAINVQNETYISVIDWMGYNDPSGGYCPEGGYGFGQCSDTIYNDPAYAIGGGCGGIGAEGVAYNYAMNYWFNEEGTGQPSHTWNNVAGAVTCALLGSTHPGCGAASAPYGLDYIHYDTAPGIGLGQSWWDVKNNTGDGYWACGYTGACPTYDQGNFTNWILQYIGAPEVNDTRAMGSAGGWLSQAYASANSGIEQMANQTAVIDKPWLQNGVPYQFWQGNFTNALADGQIFNETLQGLAEGMQMRGNGLTFTWRAPTSTIHLVDPQNDSSNMGIAPMSSTWTVSLHGAISLVLNGSRLALAQHGYDVGTQLNLSIPVNMDIPITIVTPWNLGSGWDGLSTPKPLDPAYVQTREVLGLMGKDYQGAPNFVPGTYVSAPLDNLLSTVTSIGKVLSAEGKDQASLLAALPDRAVGASAPWSQNLTLLENTTRNALDATAGTYETTVQGEFALLNSELAKVPRGGPFTDVAWTVPAFDGYLGQLNTGTDQFTYYGYPGPSSFGNLYQYNLSFSGPQVGVNYFVDNNFNGATPAAPPTHGFCGAWSPTPPEANLFCGPANSNLPGAYTLNAYWQSFQTPYRLTLTGSPSFALPAATATSSSYPSLSVPYAGPLLSYPAELSVGGEGGLPSAASTAFSQAVAGYLPYPGAFSSYVAEQKWQAALLFDNLGASKTAGVTEFGFSTALEYSTLVGASRGANFTVDLQEPGGLFGNPVQQGNVSDFLQWYEYNNEQIAYGLGALSADPTMLASAMPHLLQFVYRNVTLSTGDQGAPSTYAFLSANLACTEADLGGTGGGLADSPTILIGGGAPETWSFGGTLAVD